MSEELKYMGSTKNDIWKAYKAKVIELEELKAEPVSTTEKAKKEATTHAISIATNIDTSTIEQDLEKHVQGLKTLKAQYDELITAIEAKTAELKEVHDIEVCANDLAALAAVKEQMVQEADKRAEEIITKAEETKNEAEKYSQETLEKTRNDLNEIRDKDRTEREREQEEYDYKTARTRQKAFDTVKDELEKLQNSLDERVSSVEEREKLADEKDTKINELTTIVDTLKKECQEKEDAAFSKGEEKAKKSAQFQANMVKAHTDADTKIAQATIDNLTEKVKKLEEQIEKANERVNYANVQVAEMAQSALKAQGDVKTIGEISKIAAGGGQKK